MMIMWRKSSRSNSGGSCVEVRQDLAAVRDSKQPAGAVLSASMVPVLIKSVKAGRFDR